VHTCPSAQHAVPQIGSAPHTDEGTQNPSVKHDQFVGQAGSEAPQVPTQ